MNMQMDLLGLMADPLDLTPLSVDVRHHRDREAWESFRARWEEVEEAGQIETLIFGNAMSSRAPSYHLSLWNDDGGWRIKEDYALGDCGGGGPFGRERYRSREAAILTGFRKKMWSLAGMVVSTRQDGAAGRAQADQLARWMISRSPPLRFGGINLADEWEVMKVVEAERARLRSIAVRSAYDLHERAEAVAKDLGTYTYGGGLLSGLLINRDSSKPYSDPGGFPAEWAICGLAPDALEITIYPREGQSASPTVLAALSAFQEQLSVTVNLATEDAGYPRARVVWNDGAEDKWL